MIVASIVSSFSKDKSTKCGTIIVRKDNSICSTGYNGFPRGVSDENEYRYERPIKYLYTEHSERNSIYNSNDASMIGYSMFVYTYPKKLSICSDCARAIIQTGITDVYLLSDNQVDRWSESCQVAKIMFDESGVNLHIVDMPDLTLLTKESEKLFDI